MTVRAHLYILKNHRPVPVTDVRQWADWFEQTEKCIVAKTEIGPLTISTVFLGTDHNFTGHGDPILFETMVFRGHKVEDGDGYFQRYFTWTEAKIGHGEVVRLVRRATTSGK